MQPSTRMWTWTILSQRCDRTEIERGVIAKERTDPTQSEHLRRWFDDKVLRIFVFARRGTNLIMQPLAGHIGYSLYSGISWF